MAELKKITQLSWRKFLSTEAGRDGLLYLREKAPSIHAGESHEIIFAAGKVEGYKDCVDTISEVIGAEQEKPLSTDNDYEMVKS
jgi:hypothetical protein